MLHIEWWARVSDWTRQRDSLQLLLPVEQLPSTGVLQLSGIRKEASLTFSATGNEERLRAEGWQSTTEGRWLHRWPFLLQSVAPSPQ